jgi:hypothetical protein
VTDLFARPDPAARLTLTEEPVLESWNVAGHPDQLRLHSYLDGVAEALKAKDWPAREQRTIELVVGIPESLPIDRGGRDLDNYLFPLARRLGSDRIAAAFGRKTYQHQSTVAVALALAVAQPAEPPQLVVRTSVSAQTSAWKQAIHQACAAEVAAPLPSGPVAVRIQFSVSSRRNWTTLWKPAIDALGPVLGMPNPARPFHPDDDRIVDLELHRHLDDALRHDIVVRVWWRTAAG